jgi:cupin 2 domain-containing protein
MRSGNLHHQIPVDLPEELVETLATAAGVRIERIVSRGHKSPPDFWYDQDEAEYVLVVAGEALLEFEAGETLRLEAGQWVDIPARVRHRVAWTTPARDTVWLAVFYTSAANAD